MSDLSQNPTDDPVNPDPSADPNEAPGIRQLREANTRLEAEAAAGRSATKRLAMMDAGVDLSNPTSSLFLKTYDGPLDTESIQAEASQYGLIADPANPVEPPTPPEPATDPTPQTAARRGLGADSIDPATPLSPGDVIQHAYDEFRDLRQQGETAQDASSAVWGTIFEAARNGDPKFAFNESEWQTSDAARSR